MNKTDTISLFNGLFTFETRFVLWYQITTIFVVLGLNGYLAYTGQWTVFAVGITATILAVAMKARSSSQARKD